MFLFVRNFINVVKKMLCHSIRKKLKVKTSYYKGKVYYINYSCALLYVIEPLKIFWWDWWNKGNIIWYAQRWKYICTATIDNLKGNIISYSQRWKYICTATIWHEPKCQQTLWILQVFHKEIYTEHQWTIDALALSTRSDYYTIQ